MDEYPVTLARIEKYLALTEKALAKVSIIGDSESENYSKAQDILEMVGAYLSDSKYFLSEAQRQISRMWSLEWKSAQEPDSKIEILQD